MIFFFFKPFICRRTRRHPSSPPSCWPELYALIRRKFFSGFWVFLLNRTSSPWATGWWFCLCRAGYWPASFISDSCCFVSDITELLSLFFFFISRLSSFSAAGKNVSSLSTMSSKVLPRRANTASTWCWRTWTRDTVRYGGSIITNLQYLLPFWTQSRCKSLLNINSKKPLDNKRFSDFVFNLVPDLCLQEDQYKSLMKWSNAVSPPSSLFSCLRRSLCVLMCSKSYYWSFLSTWRRRRPWRSGSCVWGSQRRTSTSPKLFWWVWRELLLSLMSFRSATWYGHRIVLRSFLYFTKIRKCII